MSHSLNSSSAKQKFSFGKGERFTPYKANTDIYYLPTPARDRRSALIGVGERSLVSGLDKSLLLTPHAYDLPPKRGTSCSLKAGRHEIGGPLEDIKYHRGLPGPADYPAHSSLSDKGASLKMRLQDLSNKLQNDIPGPGTYIVPSSFGMKSPSWAAINPKSRNSYVEALYGNKSELTGSSGDISPGPGTYDIPKYGLQNPENVLNKKFGIKFGTEKRQGLASKTAALVPGPGQYPIYSEFD